MCHSSSFAILFHSTNTNTNTKRAGKTAQWIKGLPTKADKLRWISWPHIVEGKNSQRLSTDLHYIAVAPSQAHTQN